MEIGEKLYVNSRADWRAWLSEHHQDKKDIWLILYKGGSGKRGVTQIEAMEEALCFGWIDSMLKPVDATCYVLRFTPRRPGSSWGQSNRDRAIKLLREGKMTPAGKARLPPDLFNAWEADPPEEDK